MTWNPCANVSCDNKARYTSGYCGLCDIEFNEGKGRKLSNYTNSLDRSMVDDYDVRGLIEKIRQKRQKRMTRLQNFVSLCRAINCRGFTGFEYAVKVSGYSIEELEAHPDITIYREIEYVAIDEGRNQCCVKEGLPSGSACTHDQKHLFNFDELLGDICAPLRRLAPLPSRRGRCRRCSEWVLFWQLVEGDGICLRCQVKEFGEEGKR